jgi:uracil-DNA glycosylase
MSNLRSSFLKEMGITEWTSHEGSLVAQSSEVMSAGDQAHAQAQIHAQELATSHAGTPRVHWMFFGPQPSGDAQVLFQNVLRVLGLAKNEWSWKNPGDNLSQIKVPDSGVPVVAFAFGGPTAQKITGERDPLPQLRETILALNTGADDEIPVVASFDLSQLVSKSQEKALLWQDLLLAKSVLQNS